MKKQTISKREQNKIDCTNSILKTSRHLFSKDGYTETHMQDIAEKAGVSKATLYNYFPNKESLLIGIVDQMHRELNQGDARRAKEGVSPEERLKGICSDLVMGSMKYPELTRRLVYYHSLENSTLFRSLDPIIDLIRDVMRVLYEDILARCGESEPNVQKKNFSPAEGNPLPDSEEFVSTSLEFFLGLYYVILFHSGLSYPEDLEKIDEKMRKAMSYILKGIGQYPVSMAIE